MLPHVNGGSSNDSAPPLPVLRMCPTALSCPPRFRPSRALSFFFSSEDTARRCGAHFDLNRTSRHGHPITTLSHQPQAQSSHATLGHRRCMFPLPSDVRHLRGPRRIVFSACDRPGLIKQGILPKSTSPDTRTARHPEVNCRSSRV